MIANLILKMDRVHQKIEAYIQWRKRSVALYLLPCHNRSFASFSNKLKIPLSPVFADHRSHWNSMSSFNGSAFGLVRETTIRETDDAEARINHRIADPNARIISAGFMRGRLQTAQDNSLNRVARVCARVSDNVSVQSKSEKSIFRIPEFILATWIVKRTIALSKLCTW